MLDHENPAYDDLCDNMDEYYDYVNGLFEKDASIGTTSRRFDKTVFDIRDILVTSQRRTSTQKDQSKMTLKD